MKIIYLLGITSLFLCCNKKTEKYYYNSGELLSVVELNEDGLNHGILKKMYKTGELEGKGKYKNGLKHGKFIFFYKSGKIKAFEKYENGLLVDTSKIFYKNGKLSIKKYRKFNKLFLKKFHQNGLIISEGEIQDTLKTGWWNFYRANGTIKHRLEYLSTEKNKEYVNQSYYYDQSGKILKDSSNYYLIDFPDTLFVNKFQKGSIKLNPDLSKENDFHMVYFKFLDQKNKIIKIDSTFGKNNKEAVLWGKFSESGIKKLEGYILEKKLVQKINKKDTLMLDIYNIEHKMYFKKTIFVIDEKNEKIINKKINNIKVY